MGQALVDDDADAIWAEVDAAPGAQPGARAHEVIRTFGMDTAPLPDDPGVDWADALTRARAVARVLLLVAPVSLAAALDAAAAAWAGDYAPARAAPKNPTAFWAAAAVVVRAATAADAAPRPWPAHLSGVHAASAAGAEATWEVGRRMCVLPLPPASMLDALYYLYHAALSCDPPRFVCEQLQRGLAAAMAPWAADAFARLAALLHEAATRGAPPPRDVFGAYAGLAVGLATQMALAQPPRPPGGAPETAFTPDGAVLDHCRPVVLDAPLHDRALYCAAFEAAGKACDSAIQVGVWRGPTHLMTPATFAGRDPLCLGALPVATPPPARFEPAPMFADGAAVLWRVYDHAAQLVHTRRAPAVGAAIERQLRAAAGRETRWRAVRGPPARLRAVFQALCALGDAQPCMVPLPGVIHVEVGPGDEWHRRFCGGADLGALIDNVE